MPELLWVDDDGQDMFLYEVYELESRGWTIHFAGSVSEATQRLSTQRFDAVLLDQMMPLEAGPHQSVDVWSGCMVGWWLRTAGPPPGVPKASLEQSQHLWTPPPIPHNQTIPVVIVSAFYDVDVAEQVRAIPSPSGAVEILPKPVDFEGLLTQLGPDWEDTQ